MRKPLLFVFSSGPRMMRAIYWDGAFMQAFSPAVRVMHSKEIIVGADLTRHYYRVIRTLKEAQDFAGVPLSNVLLDHQAPGFWINPDALALLRHQVHS